MLKAFKESLINAYEQEKDELKEFLDKSEEASMDDATLERIRDYIIAVPDAIADLNALVMDPRVPNEIKVTFGALLSYVLNPHDLLPETDFGFFGYLDDAYLTHKELEHAINRLDPELKNEIFADPTVYDPIFATTKIVRNYLPAGVMNKLDRLLDMFEYSARVLSEEVSEIGHMELDLSGAV